MTGRDLIIYILENNLEDEPVFKDGRVSGYMTVAEAAAKFNVGQATIYAWIVKGWIECIDIGSVVYIPANANAPVQSNIV